jgi:hypothetical protein
MNASDATTPVLRPYLPATADFAAGRDSSVILFTARQSLAIRVRPRMARGWSDRRRCPKEKPATTESAHVGRIFM